MEHLRIEGNLDRGEINPRELRDVPKGSEFDVFHLGEGVDEEFLRKIYLGEREEYLESSGQVSPDLYCWRTGVITSPIDYTPRRPELRLPAELAAILASLAGRDSQHG